MIQQGDNVFYCDNGKTSLGYDAVAVQTIQSLGLIPFFYPGIGLDTRRSNFDRQIRDEFYQSKVAVIFLGTGQNWRSKSLGDNWAIPELPHAVSSGIICFVYITADTDEAEINSLNLPVDVITIKDKGEFEASLRQNLKINMALP